MIESINIPFLLKDCEGKPVFQIEHVYRNPARFILRNGATTEEAVAAFKSFLETWDSQGLIDHLKT